MAAMYFLQCHNPLCGRRIWLPLATHHETKCDQSPWPTDMQPRNFACPGCRQVSAYTAVELRCNPAPQEDLLQRLHAGSLICIEIACGIEGCKAPVRIHAVKAGPSFESRSILLNATATNVRCEKGHPVDGFANPATSSEDRPVTDWFL